MQAEDPTPEAARAALEAAACQHDAVRRSDMYRWSLVVLAAALVATVMAATNLRATAPVRFFLFIPMALAIGAFTSWRARKQVVYSRRSTVAFWAICAIFLGWAGIVTWTSSITGWTGSTADWHGWSWSPSWSFRC